MKCSAYLLVFFLSVATAKIHRTECSDLSSSLVTTVRKDHGHRKRISTSEIIANAQTVAKPYLKSSTARALLVSCAALYGSNYPLTKLLQDSLHASFVTALRFVIASLFFIPATIKGLRGDAELVAGSIELGVWCTIGFISQAIVLTKTSASKASFFCGLGVIMPPIFDWISNLLVKGVEEKRSAAPVVAAAGVQKSNLISFVYQLSTSPFVQPVLALSGAAIMEWGGGLEPKLSDFGLLVTPVCFSMCFWRSAQIGAKYPQETPAITGIMLTTVALAGMIWSSLTINSSCRSGSSLLIEFNKLFSTLSDVKVVGGLLYSGIFTTAMTSYIEQEAIRVLSAAETTLIYTLEPLFATGFAAAILKEHISQGTVYGAVFIVLACLWETIVSYISI
jgi:drug/metabolite transporter (DMT)-like permease